jgi:hypothetical protein
MRAVLLILILAVVVVIIAIGSGFLDINQVRGAKAPDIDASRNGVTAVGGQAPAFDIETGSVAVGSAKPMLPFRPSRLSGGHPAEANQNAPVTNNAM